MVGIVESNGILNYGAVGSCVLQFLCFTAVSCQKYWAKNTESQEFCSLIASQLYIWLMIHSLFQRKFAVSRWALTRAIEGGPEEDTPLHQTLMPYSDK